MHQVNIRIDKKLFYRFLAIVIGAFCGGVIRWQVKNYLIVNLIGSMMLGFLLPFKQLILIQALLGFGFCGSFTTFSGWIMNSIYLAFHGFWLDAILSILWPLFLGLVFAIFGFFLGKKFSLIMPLQ